jgi:hypothetical protein
MRRIVPSLGIALLLVAGILSFVLESSSRKAPPRPITAVEPDRLRLEPRHAASRSDPPIREPAVREPAAAEPEGPGEKGEEAIAGFLQDRYGAPVSGASLKAFRSGTAGPALRGETRSDHQGAFTLEGLDGGEYTLQARREGFVDMVVPAARCGEDLVLTLARPATLAGQVVDAETGVAVDAFRLRFVRAGEALREEPFRNPAGAFHLGGLAPGSYGIQVVAEGRSSEPLVLEVDDDQTIEGLEVSLQVQSQGRSKGG